MKNYRPVSIYRIPVSKVNKAAYPVIDVHSHDFVKSDNEIAQWIQTMDACGIEKTIILATTGGSCFDSIFGKFAVYGTGLKYGAVSTIPDMINRDLGLPL